MNLEPLQKQSLSEGVFGQLRDRILQGELAAGDELPSERLLSERLGVNRGAVREGLKRLQQARLIAVRHGGATQVLDWQHEAGLEMLPSLLLDAAGRINVEAARGILGLRQSLAPTVAAAAAQRRDAALTDELAGIVAQLRAASTATTRQTLCFAYWACLVAGSGNIAYRLAFNSLQLTYGPVWNLLTQVMDAEFRDVETLDQLTHALRNGDDTAARRLASQHVALGSQAVQALLDQLPARTTT